jgi:hypothetical protein
MGYFRAMGRMGLAMALSMVAGCTSYSGLVRERFEVERTCPADSTSVAERSDLKPVCIDVPPDVASDCGHWSVWEATGCGQTLVYQCRETSGRNWCTTRHAPAAQAR